MKSGPNSPGAVAAPGSREEEWPMPEAITHLTFQHHRAGEAVEFYTALVPGSSIASRTQLSADGHELIHFTIAGRPFMAADSPPVHAWDFTPAVSIFLHCDDAAEVDRIFAALAEGGAQFMPLGDYGFSPRFGWCSDRFGVSWQIGTGGMLRS
jgi:predicted 3-demethylubiquinone-9 3-methyltransferase (glyoxalase superfamily)